MTVISSGSTAAGGGQNSLAIFVKAQTGSGSTESSSDVGEAGRGGRVHHGEHHHHHGDHDGDHASWGQSASFAVLKLKVTETLSSLTGADSGDELPASSLDAGTDGAEGTTADSPEVSIQLSIRIKASGGDANQLGAAMQQFVQTLYAALRTLYDAGASEQPAASAITLPAAASASAPGVATTVPTATTPVASPVATSPNTETGQVPAASAADATVPASTAVTTAPAASVVDPVATGKVSTSISVKLRLSYNSFDNQMGSLVGQLGQPASLQGVPDLGSMLSDLGDQFKQLVSLLSGSSAGSQPSLDQFFQALAGALAPATSAAATSTPQASTVPATESTADSTDATATPEPVVSSAPAEAAPTSPASHAFIRAMASYQQVMTFDGSTQATSVQTSVSSSLEMAFA